MKRVPLIMIVDNEPSVRLTFRTALESVGYGVVDAEDGEQALERLQKTPVDLVLLDLQMPMRDGMETLRRLRAIGNNTPVVIVTAHGSIPDAVAALRLGAIDVLSKPLVPETLRAAVADVIGRHRETPQVPSTASGASPFVEKLTRGKKALNDREFDEAEFFLRQAIALNPASQEANHLLSVLREARRDREGPFRMIRDWFPVGPSGRDRKGPRDLDR